MNRYVAVGRKSCGQWLLLITLLFCLTAVVQTRAQVVGGTVLGTVTDKTGAVVAQAQILVKNLENGSTRSVTTDAAGFYAAPNLLPGTYQVTVSATGFATNVTTGIKLTVGNQQTLNVTLTVGQLTENVGYNSVQCERAGDTPQPRMSPFGTVFRSGASKRCVAGIGGGRHFCSAIRG
jgi:hypothetical protein